MSGKTILLPCSCRNAYQDSLYGLHVRVHNPCKYQKSGEIGSGARCTVCGDVKSHAQKKEVST